jgi:hypothetical protein
MKHLVALVALFFAVAAFADEIPAISARQALDAAEKSMSDRGFAKDVFVASVALTHSTVFGGETYWLVKYSHPIPAEAENQHEIGLKVRMNGSVTRLVKTLGKP